MTTALAQTGTAVISAAAKAAGQDASDKALLARIAEGDQSAMRLLFARHRTSVYRWLLRLVQDAALAEDLLSEVFIAAWRQAQSFEGRSSVSTWLMAIARHKALSARRRRDAEQLDDEMAAAIRDPADNAEAVLQERERGERLMQALQKISPEHREVIDLVYYHGKSVNDVAAILGVPAGTVKTRMFYARRKLAQLVRQ